MEVPEQRLVVLGTESPLLSSHFLESESCGTVMLLTAEIKANLSLTVSLSGARWWPTQGQAPVRSHMRN